MVQGIRRASLLIKPHSTRVIEVVAGIIECDGKVLATRRPPDDELAGLWEFPGGKLEAGESHQQCLQRELREELSIECDVAEQVADHLHDYGHKRVHLYAYRARIRQGTPQLNDHDQLVWLDESRLDELQWAPADVPLVLAYRRQCQSS